MNVRDSESGGNMRHCQIKYQVPEMNFNRPVTFNISPIYVSTKISLTMLLRKFSFIPPPFHSILYFSGEPDNCWNSMFISKALVPIGFFKRWFKLAFQTHTAPSSNNSSRAARSLTALSYVSREHCPPQRTYLTHKKIQKQSAIVE